MFSSIVEGRVEQLLPTALLGYRHPGHFGELIMVEPHPTNRLFVKRLFRKTFAAPATPSAPNN